MPKLLNSSLMFFLLFSFSAIADILRTLPIALDTLIFKTHGMHYTQFGDELDKVTLELAGLTEVYREDADDGKYVVYLEKGTKDFQIYYWPITQSFLVTFEGNSATNFFDLLENLKLADASSSQVGTGKPDMLTSKGFPPKFISISYPEGMAEGLTGFLFRISRNKSKPINKFIYDLTYDLVLYRETLGLNKILDLYLFTKAAENLYERKFPDRTEAFVAINDNVVGITATELNLNDLKEYVYWSA